jgi:TonB-dependent receptor
MTRQRLAARLLFTTASVLLAAAAARPATAQTTAGKETSSVETVVVTGTRIQATKIKEDAPNVLDIRPVTEIQKLPDVNLAEALQRVPGISMESDSGEGRFINIRGMDADLNGTTFDGVRLTASNPSSPQGGGRAVAFDAFPSGLFGGVEVIKSLVPNIDAEGLGGIVNILPRTVPDGADLLADVSLGGGVEALRGSPVWDGDATVGYRFGPSDSMTMIVTYAYHEDHRGINDIENGGYTDYNAQNQLTNIENQLQYRWYEYHRIRQGIGAGWTWDIDSKTSVFARGFDAGYTEWASKHRLEFDNLDNSSNVPPAPPPTLNAQDQYVVTQAMASQQFTDSKERIGNRLAEFGGHTILGDDIAADFRASWTEGSDVVPFSYGFGFTDPNNINLAYDNTTDPNHPWFRTLDGTNTADPSIYTSGTLSNSTSYNSDQEVAGVFDFTVPVSVGGTDGAFKFGGSVRGRIRRAIASANDGSTTVGNLANYAMSNDQIYYNNLYNLGPMANLQELAAIPETPLVVDPTTYEHDNENVYAGYAQYSTSFGKLDLLGGVRIETTNATYTANEFITVNNPNQPTLNANKQDYTNVFPDLNAKYQVTDELLVRAAFSTSIARPGFDQITAAKTYDYSNDVITEGNPSLKATTADNIDLTAEYYLANGGLATGGLFYKSFSNYIIPTTAFVAVSSPPFNSPTAMLNSFSNIGAATAQGFELNYVQQFTSLPGMLSGFGVDDNMTYIDSSGDIRVDDVHTLPQTSPWNFNAAVFYERDGFDVRLATSYVSKNIFAVGSDPTQDIYSQPRLRLDFGSSYTFLDKYEVYFNIKNMSNTKLEFTQTASKALPIQREYYDADYLFGIRAHL